MHLEGLYTPMQSTVSTIPMDSNSPPPIVQPCSSGGIYMHKFTHFLIIIVLTDGTSNPRADEEERLYGSDSKSPPPAVQCYPSGGIYILAHISLH